MSYIRPILVVLMMFDNSSIIKAPTFLGEVRKIMDNLKDGKIDDVP